MFSYNSLCHLFLALKAPNTEKWILNGVVEQRGQDGRITHHKMVTPFRKIVTVNGTMIEYSGSNTVEERINITQQINQPLELLVRETLSFMMYTNCKSCERLLPTA